METVGLDECPLPGVSLLVGNFMVLLALYESHCDPHKANFWWNTLNCCTHRCSLSEVQKDQKGKVEGHLSLARQQIEVCLWCGIPCSCHCV